MRQGLQNGIGHLPAGVQAGELVLAQYTEDGVPVLLGKRLPWCKLICFPINLIESSPSTQSVRRTSPVDRVLLEAGHELGPALKPIFARAANCALASCGSVARGL